MSFLSFFLSSCQRRVIPLVQYGFGEVSLRLPLTCLSVSMNENVQCATKDRLLLVLMHLPNHEQASKCKPTGR
jgi:hypothetical protein